MRLFIASLVITFCGSCASGDGAEDADTITVWFHTGREGERHVIQEQVRQFNQRQEGMKVDLVLIPEGSYNGQVQASALAGDLPDILEFDGPYVYNYVWQGRLAPIDELLPAQLLDDLLPTIVEQGTYRGRLYTVGAYDSGLGLYARRSRLEAVGARIPQGPSNAWSVGEFETILRAAARCWPWCWPCLANDNFVCRA